MTIALLLVSCLSTLSFFRYLQKGKGSGGQRSLLSTRLGSLIIHSSVIFIKKIQKAWDL